MPLDKLNDLDKLGEQRTKINATIDEVNTLTPVAKADPNLTTAQVTEELKAVAHYNEPMCGKISFDKPIRFVVMGASIMDGTFGTETRRTIFQNELESKGLTVYDVTEYAVGGNTSTVTLSVVPTVISDFSGSESQTVVILHTGTNDIRAHGPYPGGATTLDSNYRQIITDLKAAGLTVIPSTIAFIIPPALSYAAPYNEGIIINAIMDTAPEAMRLSGRPIIDLYRHTLVTPNIHDPDGIHYTSDGYDELARFIGSQLPDLIENHGATVSTISDLIIDFGSTYTSVDFGGFLAGSTDLQETSSIYDINGKRPSDLTVAITGFADGFNSTGTNYGGTGYSIDRPEITRDSIFVAHPGFSGTNGEIGQISFTGSSVEPAASYDVTIAASRSITGGDHWGNYTCGGVSKDINAADSGVGTLQTAVFSNVTGAQLIATGITVTRRDPELASFAYVNGIRITKL
jgi:lysophospholipase L1-like esterase